MKNRKKCCLEDRSHLFVQWRGDFYLWYYFKT